MSSDSPINNRPWPDQDSSKNYALSGRIMLASVVSLFVIVFFLVILHLYARWYLVRLQFRNRRNRRRNRSTRIIFYVDNNNNNNSNNNTTTGGLDATVLKSLPVFVYSESDVDMPECAVCLSEFEPGETGRVLPKCKHGFHTGCIDMWFSSNSTCPLCRTPVEAIMDTTSFQDNNNIIINNNMSKQDDVGSSGGDNRMKRVDVRIEVPNRNELATGETELSMTSPSQGFRSPGGRLLSRIINMSRKWCWCGAQLCTGRH